MRPDPAHPNPAPIPPIPADLARPASLGSTAKQAGSPGTEMSTQHRAPAASGKGIHAFLPGTSTYRMAAEDAEWTSAALISQHAPAMQTSKNLAREVSGPLRVPSL